MTPDERRKAIATGIALAVNNPLVPLAARVALAALAEEIADLRRQIEELHHANGT